MKGRNANSTNVVHRKSKFLPRLILVLSISLVVGLVTFFTYKIVNRYMNRKESVALMNKYWDEYDYSSVYEISQNIIDKSPLQNSARTLHGYASFFLGVSQTNNSLSLDYIDEAIQNLRIALLNCSDEARPQIYAMLGKSYFYKDSYSSYIYYADLVIKYLNLAMDLGYKEDDMSRCLGLSYASIGMIKESIASFTEALNVRESESLLVSIAKQYCNNGQSNIAKQYLFQVLNSTSDDMISEMCHGILGEIYLEEGELDQAESEFLSILEKNEKFADAHYGLGVIYSQRGDAAKARSEWRRTLQIEANHSGALEKLGY